MPADKLLYSLLPVLALPALLGSCAIGAYFSPVTAFERSVNGMYEGEGNGITGRVPYRLTLTVQEQAQRANAVLVNLESRKTYTGSGKFTRTTTGGQLDLNFFEDGNKFRAAIHADLTPETISGQLRTVLLGRELLPYNITFKKVSSGP
ncbi:hypothetical protein [Deinococcus fonticola]|uniref:hypothetical protein n=1 Tax=Deinococcus fonticola TaxID=2528713 RepID=UPI001431C81F|nr:hypothetical protein [Deinococcus fonticola]